MHPSASPSRTIAVLLGAVALFGVSLSPATALAETAENDAFTECGFAAFQANPTEEGHKKFTACITALNERLVATSKAEIERIRPGSTAPKTPCDPGLFAFPDHHGLPNRFFSLLHERKTAEAYALLSPAYARNVAVGDLARHIDDMLWSGRTLAAASGLQQLGGSGFDCRDGKLAIRDEVQLTLDDAAPVTVVVHAIKDGDTWKIDGIERVGR